MIEQAILISAASGLTKTLIDLVAMMWLDAQDPPRWIKPVLAIVGGIGFSLLFLVAQDVALTNPAIAQAIIAGILAGGGAVGITVLARLAERA